MQIIPTLEIMGKKCVKAGSATRVFSYSPAKAAEEMVAQGAKLLHVVDLDGAKSGKLANFDILDQLSYICLMEIEGGVREISSINKIISIASVPVVEERYANEGLLGKIKGNEKKVAFLLEGEEAASAAAKLQIHCGRIICEAPRVEGKIDCAQVRKVRKVVKGKLFVKGIRTPEEIKEMKKEGVDGCVLAGDFFTGEATLKDAIAAAK